MEGYSNETVAVIQNSLNIIKGADLCGNIPIKSKIIS